MATEFDALERRIAALEVAVREQQELRTIEQLRYRYWYALLDKNVDGLMSCFTADAFVEYGFGVELRGADAIRKFFGRFLAAEDLVRQVPRGDNPQLEFLTSNHAHGRWLVDVVAIRSGQEFGRRMSVQYDETYRKIDGDWKISHIKNDYLSFEQITLLKGP